MKKKVYILYIGVKSLDSKYRREIICDRFDNPREPNQWVNWLGRLWELVTTKRLQKPLKSYWIFR